MKVMCELIQVFMLIAGFVWVIGLIALWKNDGTNNVPSRDERFR